jgi:solute carrier family 25 carnitine/acylcarnitine transporter 20/29
MIAGVLSGCTKLAVGHPFDTLKVRMQTEGLHGRFRGPLDCMLQTLRSEGITAFYKGASLPLLGWSVIDFVLIGTYVNTRAFLQKTHADTDNVPVWHYWLAGGLAGCVRAVIATPVEQVKSRLQVQYADPKSKVYSGPIDCMRQLVRNNGIRGLFKGFQSTLIFGTSLSVYFASYEWYNRTIRVNFPDKVSNSLRQFVSGGMAGTTLWLVAFPVDVIKSRMQAQPDVANPMYRSIGDCARKIYAREGLRGFYSGFLPCILRSFPTNGAALMVTEAVLLHLP